MKYKLEDLQNLVQSMSGQEKRYFSLFSETFSFDEKKALYLQLFQALAKPGSELPRFENEISDQAFTTTKKRLFRNILKAMGVFHHERSPDIIIQNCLNETEILFHLNLPDQGLFPLTKGYELAVRYEKFGLQLQLLEWERRLNMVLNKPTRGSELIRAEEREVLAKMQQVMDLEFIYSKAKELKKKYGYVKGVMKTSLKRETIADKSMPVRAGCFSRKALYYYNFIHALYYWMTFDHNNAYNYSKELLSPEMQLVLPEDYIDGILEHVTSCVCIGNFEAALNGLSIAAIYLEEQKLHLSNAYRLKLFYYRVSYQIIIYNYTGMRSKLAAAIKDAEKELKQFEGQLTLESKLVITGNLMNGYLGLGNHKKVDELWNSMFRKQSQSARRDIYDDLYFFRLFHLLQTWTYELLPAMAISAFKYYRKFKDHQKHFSLELGIATLLMKDRNYEKTEIRRELFEQISTMLGTYIKSLKGAAQFQEHYTLYVIWIDSLLNERPFHEEAAAWYNIYKNVVTPN